MAACTVNEHSRKMLRAAHYGIKSRISVVASNAGSRRTHPHSGARRHMTCATAGAFACAEM